MDAKLVFWSASLLNMALLVVVAVAGVGRIRRGDAVGHRRAMLVSTALVLLFVTSYAVKLAVLGREDFTLWVARDRWILRLHELCVASMLGAGAVALWRGRRLARAHGLAAGKAGHGGPGDRVHRVAGRVAIAAATLGLGLAALVLAGMYERAGF